MTDNATPEATTTPRPRAPRPKPAPKPRRSFMAELRAAEKRIELALALMEAAEATEDAGARQSLYRVAREKLEAGK